MALRDIITIGFGPATGSGGPAPAAPTLTVADNGDGTGAVATIAASTAGSSNAVYTQLWPGPFGVGGTWTLRGTRTGNGTVALALTVGYYLVQVVSTLNSQEAVSGVALLCVSDHTLAVWYRATLAVQAGIQALGLKNADGSNLDSAKILAMKIITDRSIPAPGMLPAILVAPILSEVLFGGTNVERDYGFPVGVCIVAASNQDYGLGPADEIYLRWRQQIELAFDDQRLAGVSPPVMRGTLEPGLMLDATQWQTGNLWVNSLVLRFQARMTRR